MAIKQLIILLVISTLVMAQDSPNQLRKEPKKLGSYTDVNLETYSAGDNNGYTETAIKWSIYLYG